VNGVYMPLQLQARYCPGGPSSCPAGPTSIQLHDILFQNITGTGRSPLVGTFVCDAHAPCHDVRLDHVVLGPEAQAGEVAAAARFACENAFGSADGSTQPQSCLRAGAPGPDVQH